MASGTVDVATVVARNLQENAVMSESRGREGPVEVATELGKPIVVLLTTEARLLAARSAA